MKTFSHVWYCAVSIGTVWSSPESVRESDTDCVGNPVHIVKWLEKNPAEVRITLYADNRVQTQLVYGEPVIIERIQGNWAKVIAVWQPSKKNKDGYPGWIPLVQLKEMQSTSAIGYVKVRVARAQLFHEDGTPSLVVPMNTVLPYIDSSQEFILVNTPDGHALISISDVEKASTPYQFIKKNASYAVDKGLDFLDTPYLWGGMTPYGFDCSGFTFQMLKAGGHLIARDASDQAKGGIVIDIGDSTNWQKGDLLFFAKSNEGTAEITHVGFYCGNGILLHSPSTGKSVELVMLEDSRLKEELCAVRRYEVESN